MGERYEITNRGKDEEIGHSTHLLRSMDEGNRKKWNIYLSIRFRGRGGENVQLLRTFFPVIRNKMFRFFWNIYVPYQNRTYFWESDRSEIGRRFRTNPKLSVLNILSPKPPASSFVRIWRQKQMRSSCSRNEEKCGSSNCQHLISIHRYKFPPCYICGPAQFYYVSCWKRQNNSKTKQLERIYNFVEE